MSEHARKRARAVLRGRDDGNVILLPDRSFIGWYRHITLVLVALAYLAGICATARDSISPPATSEFPPRPSALPLTIVSRAPSARTAHLALFFVCTPGAGLVVVASLPPKHGELLSHQMSSEGRLIPGWYLYNPLTVLPTALFPRLPGNFLEVSEFLEFRSRVSTIVFS